MQVDVSYIPAWLVPGARAGSEADLLQRVGLELHQDQTLGSGDRARTAAPAVYHAPAAETV